MDNVEIVQCDDYIAKIVDAGFVESAKFESEYPECMVLPASYNGDEYYYAQETIDFLKFARESDSGVSIAIPTDRGIETRSLHSFDIFMPVIWIANSVFLPIVVNLVSNYLKDKLRGREKEEANVELSFVVERKSEKKMIHYKGPASEFKENFSEIDINKL